MVTSDDTNERSTPDWAFRALDDIFYFELDAAATAENAKCPLYFSKDGIDGLTATWAEHTKGPIFLNPPFGRGLLRRWMEKAVEASLAGVRVVSIAPADFSTQWSRIVRSNARYICFAGTRWKFNGIATGAKQPTIICVFEPAGTTIDHSLMAELEALDGGWCVAI